MALLILAYVAAIVLTALGVGLATSLARRSGQRVHQVFLFLVIVNDLSSLAEILLKLFPARLGSAGPRGASLLSGFIAFPLMAAFSYLVIDWLLTLASQPFPKAVKRIVAAYWGLLFVGFLAAEFRQLEYQDLRLSLILEPFFDAGIGMCGLGAAGYAAWRAGRIGDAAERRFVRKVCLYVGITFPLFGLLYLVHLPIHPAWQILSRGLLGLVYLLPPLWWMRVRHHETRRAPLTRLATADDAVARWLTSTMLSPREREIVRCVIEGKTNGAIGEELFIGVRTVESHLHSIYRKLGVKNRLQLARRAAVESETARHTS
jgi:DNA-binding CsgD family transcriptional regulator